MSAKCLFLVCSFFAVGLVPRAEATSRLFDIASSVQDLVKAATAPGALSIPEWRQLAAEGNGKAYPLIEFKVPPQHGDEFVALFKKVSEIVHDTEPEVKYSLSRQSDGNEVWYIYGEFASVEAYNKHASQQYEHDFYYGVNDLGIVWQSHLLQPIAG